MTARNFLADSYYFGLESYIMKFIEKNSVLKYCNSDISVNRGEPILNISGGWGDVDVLSPLDFWKVLTPIIWFRKTYGGLLWLKRKGTRYSAARSAKKAILISCSKQSLAW